MPTDLHNFDSPHALWLLLAVPLIVLWAWVEKRQRAVLRFSAARVLVQKGRGLRPWLVWVLPVLRIAGIALAILALARPQERDARVRDLSVEGIDIMIA